MVAAVGASTTYNPATSGGSKRGLEAQADTLKKQLGDWVTCPSAKTPAGKAKIADLTNKLDATQARIKALDKAQTSHSNDAGISTANAQRTDALAAARNIARVDDTKSVEAATQSSAPGAGPGSLVNVFV
ncbi:MAG: hypothetical protein JWM03_909 [Rhodocyclales bacterium]|nr:hypothetical protein [Rhodocyclales bacterium]MDB5888037.1 hypothetical protein [Rhodocyclales bacterium]